MSRKVTLVAFADGVFAPRKRKFLEEAHALGVFDECAVFDRTQLPAMFSAQHLPFMEAQARGFGYWIWKPQVILQAFDRAGPDDLVVYLDAGFSLNPAGKARMLEYFEIANDSSYKMLSFQNVHTENMWTKMDLAGRLGVAQSPQIMNTSQLTAGFMILGKTPSNVDLVGQWQEIAVEANYHYSDDSPSVLPNHVAFREHRHDMSISSLLRKIRGTAITHYEVQSYEWAYEALRPTLPALATRLRV
jgi:hypothetical protein